MPYEHVKDLITRLSTAYVCCKDCGIKYGVYSVGCSSTYVGHCDVCLREDVPVTETRDWGYLVTGIHKLSKGFSDPLEQIYYEYPLVKQHQGEPDDE